MRALMVYDSKLGDTRDVAASIADGLVRRCEIELAEISEAPSVPATDVDLLIVGVTAVFAHDVELRTWLAGLPETPSPTAAAAFDTRVRVRGRLSSAARGTARRLQRCGYRLLDKPESFYVADVTGPLVEGELVRAWAWGHRIGVDLANSRPYRPAARHSRRSRR